MRHRSAFQTTRTKGLPADTILQLQALTYPSGLIHRLQVVHRSKLSIQNQFARTATFLKRALVQQNRRRNINPHAHC
jgi:hypothetical protein